MENDGKKTGRAETNLLEWERSWKNMKILKYPTRFATELRLGVRENPNVDDVLAENVMLPEVDTRREYCVPTVIEDQLIRTAMQNVMLLAWIQA